MIERARRGDRRALSHLFQLHYESMVHVALRVTRDMDKALDALQDACIRVIQNVDKFRGDSSFSSWMAIIVVNAARRQFRSERRFVPLIGEGLGLQEANGPSPEVTATHRQALERAVQKLQDGRDGDYQLFMRRFVSGDSVRSVSLDTGLSIPTVKTRVHRARIILKQAMEEAS